MASRNRIQKLISFLKETEKLKTIERYVWISNTRRRESSAEHSWDLAMFLLLFQKDIGGKFNFLRTIKLVLTHDLVEIYAGDTFLFDRKSRKTKKAREARAAKKLFSQLPADLKTEFSGLFKEYEENKTKEAKLAHSVDKLQPIIQNIVSGAKSWKKHKVTEDLINSHKINYMKHNSFILAVYKTLINEIKRKKLI